MIRMLLDLSTAHLPHHLGNHWSAGGGLGAVPGVVAYRTDYGWLMWVPPDPANWAATADDSIPDEIVAVQQYARSRGCDYVLFDADADRIDYLPTWNW